MNCVINTFGKHEAKLRGFLTLQSGSPVQADDILQKTFCVLQPKVNNHMNKLGKITAALVFTALAISTASATEDTSTAVPSNAIALPKVIDLGADRCIPCKKMAPILDQLREDCTSQFEVVFIDAWKNHDAGELYRPRVIPTQIFFDANCKELFRHGGFYSRDQILGKWHDLGFDFVTDSDKLQ